MANLAKFVEVFFQLVGNLVSRDTVISFPGRIQALAFHKAHEYVSIKQATMILDISLYWTVRVASEDFWYRYSFRVFFDEYHAFSLAGGDVGSELNYKFWSYLRYLHAAPVEDSVAGINLFIDDIRMGHLKAGNGTKDIIFTFGPQSTE